MGEAAVYGVSATTWPRSRALCATNPYGHIPARVRAAHLSKAMTAVRPEGRLGDGPG